MNVFVPTPTPEAHSLLEVAALRKGYSMRTLDIVAAFLIGTVGLSKESRCTFERRQSGGTSLLSGPTNFQRQSGSCARRAFVTFGFGLTETFMVVGQPAVFTGMNLKRCSGSSDPASSSSEASKTHACTTAVARMSRCFTTSMTFGA